MAMFLSALSFLFIYTAILLVTGLAGLFSEKSGTLALSLEGNMTMGALFGGLAMTILPESLPAPISCILIILLACLGAGIYSLLLAISTITFKANQTLVGTALNILSVALAVVGIKFITRSEITPAGLSRLSFTYYYELFNFQIPGMENVRFNWLVILIAIILPIVWFVLNKTRFGLRLISVGENPSASDSVGINVNRTRYSGVIICGALSGLGGLTLLTTGATWEYSSGANGFGYLALAVIIFGQWKPIMILVGSLIFALFKTISIVYPNINFLATLNISSYFYLMLPYIVCLVALIFTSKMNKSPKALGTPYEKSER